MAYHLRVDRRHVLEGLKLVRKTKTIRRRHDPAVVGFDGSFLTVEAAGVTFLARAAGTWPGNAIVSDTLFQALAAAPPVEDPIVVTCDGKHLGFGPLKVACKWQPISSVVLLSSLAFSGVCGTAGGSGVLAVTELGSNDAGTSIAVAGGVSPTAASRAAGNTA